MKGIIRWVVFVIAVAVAVSMGKYFKIPSANLYWVVALSVLTHICMWGFCKDYFKKNF